MSNLFRWQNKIKLKELRMKKIKKIIEKAIVRKPVLLDNEPKAIRVYTDIVINIDGEMKKYTFEEFKSLLGF